MKKLMYPVCQDRLFIGPHLLDVPESARREALAERHITMVINCWWRVDPVLADAVIHYHHVSLPDGKLDDRALAAFDAYSRVAAEWLASGGGVLVQCYGGRNRSGLLAALAAREWQGITGAEAFDLVRAGRGPSSLKNQHYAAVLRSLPAPSRA